MHACMRSFCVRDMLTRVANATYDEVCMPPHEASNLIEHTLAATTGGDVQLDKHDKAAICVAVPYAGGIL